MQIKTTKLSTAQQRINRYFPKRPIAYQPGLGQVISVNAGVMLSQLLYWYDRGANRDGWVYKTVSEMNAETGLTRYQQETAIKKCEELGILEVKLKGIPAKRHFKLNLAELENQLPKLKENANVVYLNPPTQLGVNHPAITDNTHETTSKTTQFGSSNFRRGASKTTSVEAVLSQRFGDRTFRPPGQP